MKKLIILLIILFAIQNHSYAKLIEFEKCYSAKGVYNSDGTDTLNPENVKWSEDYYKIRFTEVYHPFDPDKYEKVIKIKDRNFKLGENLNFFKEIKNNTPKEANIIFKEYEKQGFYKVYPTHELYWSIDTTSGIMTRTIIHSQQQMQSLENQSLWFNLQRQKKGEKGHKFEQEKIINTKFKIDNYSGGIIQASRLNAPSGIQKIAFDLKNNLVTSILSIYSSKELIYKETEFYICKSLTGSKKGSDYTQYWWAFILIAAVIFFIYTQTGKELKIKKK